MKFSKSMVLVSFFALLLTGCTNSGGGGGGKRSSKVQPMELSEEQWAIYNEHYTNKVDCYGNDVAAYDFINKIGYDLMQEVHNYLIDQHTVYYRYNQINGTLYKKIDRPSAASQQIELFYSGKCINSYSSTQNREHVWPCERSTGLWYRQASTWEQKIDTNSQYWGGGSDLFHVRPADGTINSVRSNARFYQFGEGEYYEEQGETGGLYNIKVDMISSAKKVEVADAFKGDTARLLAYMYIHYNQMGHDVYYSNSYTSPTPVYTKDEAIPYGQGSDGKNHDPNVCGRLSFSDIFAYKDENECIRVLKEWNKIDEPSETEIVRNETVQELQHNRNPFVDFPQLIDRCFG